jgi:hypothetical protein
MNAVALSPVWVHSIIGLTHYEQTNRHANFAYWDIAGSFRRPNPPIEHASKQTANTSHTISIPAILSMAREARGIKFDRGGSGEPCGHGR